MKHVLFSCLLACASVMFSSCAAPMTTEEKNAKLPPLSQEELKVLKIMGGRVLDDGNIGFGKVTIDRSSNEVFFPGKVNVTEGDLEVLICTPSGRAHESLLVSDIDPYKLQLALLLAGAANGTRNAPEEKDGAKPAVVQGSIIDIFIKPEKLERFPIEQWLMNKKTKREKKQEGWVFVGSSFTADKQCLATEEGNIVNLWSFGNTILDNPSTTGDTDDIFVSYTKRMFPYETPLTIIMKKRD